MKHRIPLTAAEHAARRLREQLEPFCERIEIAGSIRRRKAEVGDLELVAIPRVETTEQRDLFGVVSSTVRRNLLDEKLAQMERDPSGPIFRSRDALFQAVGLPADGVDDVKRWGDRMKRFYFLWPKYGVIPIDLFIADRMNWGAIFTIRTGSGDFSQAFVTHLKRHTPYRQSGGYLIVEETGAIVPVPEEADYFAAAGVPWIEPDKRSLYAFKTAMHLQTQG